MGGGWARAAQWVVSRDRHLLETPVTLDALVCLQALVDGAEQHSHETGVRRNIKANTL